MARASAPDEGLTLTFGRRTILTQALVSAGILALAPAAVWCSPGELASNITRLYPVRVSRIERPTSVDAVVQAIRSWPGKLAAGGGRYSMGGQTAVTGGLHLDMRGLNALGLDPS